MAAAPTLNPSAPLDRRKKRAPEGPEVSQVVEATGKGKQKRQPNPSEEDRWSDRSRVNPANGPLEVAYGPIIGTTRGIGEDHADAGASSGVRRSPPGAAGTISGDAPPHNESSIAHADGSGQWERSGEEDNSEATPPTYGIGGDEDEFLSLIHI